ncbi:GBRAL-like protein [Mya arenaria]|uniref:GBRAL-like protein n=1 Tax=Mya arenaria TaxID=6604 RepID=A0ABY7DJL6_MYAAR|nr:GBRAL-like protein [Mya arenaria]
MELITVALEDMLTNYDKRIRPGYGGYGGTYVYDQGMEVRTVITTSVYVHGMEERTVITTSVYVQGMVVRTVTTTSVYVQGIEVRTVITTGVYVQGMEVRTVSTTSVYVQGIEGMEVRIVITTSVYVQGMEVRTVITTSVYVQGNEVRTVITTSVYVQVMEVRTVTTISVYVQGKEVRTVTTTSVYVQGMEVRTVTTTSVYVQGMEGMEVRIVITTSVYVQGMEVRTVITTSVYVQGNEVRTVTTTSVYVQGMEVRTVTTISVYVQGMEVRTVTTTSVYVQGMEVRIVITTSVYVQGMEVRILTKTSVYVQGMEVRIVNTTSVYVQDEPVEVQININIRSLGPISEMDMAFTMDCYFRQVWTDERLAMKSHTANSNMTEFIQLSIKILERIWYPDTVFYNGMKSYLHTITTPNRFIRIYRSGKILFSQRLTVRAMCKMQLRKYPLDEQNCPLHIGSFAYSTKDVIYIWRHENPVEMPKDMRLSQFDLMETPINYTSVDFFKGAWHTVLSVDFRLSRHIGYFLINVYVPCCLLVILSWVAFWINREATADRIALVRGRAQLHQARLRGAHVGAPCRPHHRGRGGRG